MPGRIVLTSMINSHLFTITNTATRLIKYTMWPKIKTLFTIKVYILKALITLNNNASFILFYS